MRSGCSLPATVLLLLFTGLAVWGARHWKPNIICDNASLSWFCGGYANAAGGLPGHGGNKQARGSDADRGARKGKGTKKVAQALPWPIAEKPQKWNNFRKGAYSVPAKRKPVKAKSVTAAHGFPWPIAEKPRKWTNVRKAPKRNKIVAKKARNKTVAHPFAWPIAEEPRKWTNVRKAPKRVRHAAPAVPYADNYVSHNVAPPRNALQLLVLRVKKKSTPAPRKHVSPALSYSDSYVGHNVAPPRNALQLLVLRVKKGAMKKASTCGTELNRVARGGAILFETASARLRDSSYDTLDTLAGVAKTCDRVNIVVEGHTDDSGSAGFNQNLSERRAQSVAAYLQGAGVSADSLSAVGYGESRPAVPNSSRANMAKNRRIEFSVSGN